MTVTVLGLIDPSNEPAYSAAMFSFPIWFTLSLPVSYAVTVLAGLPAFLTFRRLGWLSRAKVVCGVSVIGSLVGVPIGAVFGDKPVERSVIALLFIAFGAISGQVFWRLAYYPPRSEDSPDSV